MSEDLPDSLIPYDEIVQEALRAVVGRVLGEVQQTGGLPGAHHRGGRAARPLVCGRDLAVRRRAHRLAASPRRRHVTARCAAPRALHLEQSVCGLCLSLLCV